MSFGRPHVACRLELAHANVSYKKKIYNVYTVSDIIIRSGLKGFRAYPQTLI